MNFEENSTAGTKFVAEPDRQSQDADVDQLRHLGPGLVSDSEESGSQVRTTAVCQLHEYTEHT